MSRTLPPPATTTPPPFAPPLAPSLLLPPPFLSSLPSPSSIPRPRPGPLLLLAPPHTLPRPCSSLCYGVCLLSSGARGRWGPYSHSHRRGRLRCRRSDSCSSEVSRCSGHPCSRRELGVLLLPPALAPPSWYSVSLVHVWSIPSLPRMVPSAAIHSHPRLGGRSWPCPCSRSWPCRWHVEVLANDVVHDLMGVHLHLN